MPKVTIRIDEGEAQEFETELEAKKVIEDAFAEKEQEEGTEKEAEEGT